MAASCLCVRAGTRPCSHTSITAVTTALDTYLTYTRQQGLVGKQRPGVATSGRQVLAAAGLCPVPA
jgi:hypothetical protein